jgi:hypothetical protein
LEKAIQRLSRRDALLSVAALLLPIGAMVGTALALLKPALPPTALGPAKIFLGSGRCGDDSPVGTDAPEGSCPDDLRRQLGTVPHFAERFAAAFAVLPAPVEPEEPPPPVPLPPVRPPDEPAPEPQPEPWAPSGAVARSSGLHTVAGDICSRHGSWRVETGRSWHCAYRHR